MKGKWLIEHNHIALSVEEEILHPNADELYLALSNDEESFIKGIECMSIRDAFPELRFSKIGSDIRCELRNDEEKIILNLYCERKGNRVPVDVIQGQIIDQCVLKNEWFYVTGSTKEVEELFRTANILNCGIITVSQYVELLRNKDKLVVGSFINLVETSVLDKPINRDGELPKGVDATLYNYQKTGYFWMKYMLAENTGCILGDEMGLGKTLQIITLMQDFKNNGKIPMLVVAPVSLLQNWKRECNRFAPKLKTLIHHGSKRTGRYKDFDGYDVIVISYNTAVSDMALLSMISWNLVVLDEAQNIKNPDSDRTRYVKKIPRNSSIAVSGTPFENHVSDIWSLVDFIKPGLFGTRSEYDSYITDDVDGADKIEPLLSPLMIRRLVSDVATDLPEKVVIPQEISMSDIECVKYEEFRRLAAGSGSSVGLGALQKLRMYCTHPQVCDEEVGKDPFSCSVKYQRMCEILEEVVERGEKVILFTSFQKMFEILQKDIPERFNIPVNGINGNTPVEDRQGIVDKFNKFEGSFLLVLNPRAAGTGLNITAANHVIHYNLEWNPALEDQASARAYRRGQEKTVFVYRLFYRDTVEQIVNDRIERKREIAETAVVGTDGKTENKEDIILALNISPAK
ncbi:MAG: DEAD/DEAH box helicase [Lachnospiraceae bacterium]|nr:DEAD/DEAH box helicase [Lachnospiraceae bacterium]